MPPRRGAGDRLFRCGAESSPRRKALNDERRHGPAQREDTPRRAGPETKAARAGGHRCVRCESRRQGGVVRGGDACRGTGNSLRSVTREGGTVTFFFGESCTRGLGRTKQVGIPRGPRKPGRQTVHGVCVYLRTTTSEEDGKPGCFPRSPSCLRKLVDCICEQRLRAAVTKSARVRNPSLSTLANVFRIEVYFRKRR